MTKTHEAHEFEFFGPWVPAFLVLVLPGVCYGLFFGCNADSCLQVLPSLRIPTLPPVMVFYSHTAVLAVAGLFLLVLALHMILPGKKVQGVVLPDGTRLTYKLNALTIFFVLYSSALYFGFVTGQLNLSWVYDNYLSLLTASVLLATALSFYLYARSFSQGAYLCEHAHTGYFGYEFWMGRELNPRWFGGSVDIKEFCELYPGMMGWLLINLSMAHKQQQQLGYVSNTLILTNLFQLYYVLDALWNEAAILTTMDITSDGFGFMLAFGDLVWVPFVFTTASRFLVDYPQDMSAAGVALVLGVKLLGLYIFRGANSQKDAFRRDPSAPANAHLRTLKTERGTQLIISGWWGMSRHINYFGDWIMGVSWCMPTGLAGLRSVIPYFYCIYFATLLLHRQMRDESMCRKKYGKDWDKYCSIVKSRIVPYLY